MTVTPSLARQPQVYQSDIPLQTWISAAAILGASADTATPAELQEKLNLPSARHARFVHRRLTRVLSRQANEATATSEASVIDTFPRSIDVPPISEWFAPHMN